MVSRSVCVKMMLCVIDLDTVMPSFIFSDFGDFLRSAANTGKEDEADLNKVKFNMEIFKAFTKGYIESARAFAMLFLFSCMTSYNRSRRKPIL